MNREFEKPSAAIRWLFAAIALVMTVSVGVFIDQLATDYQLSADANKQSRPVAVASQ